MIDTIRFKMALTDSQYVRIRSLSTEVTELDNESETTNFVILKNSLPLGSYDRKINIFVTDEKQCFLEFSVPKFQYGHNVYMVFPEEVPEIVEKVQKKLDKYFHGFPASIFWELQRIDLCYSWKFPDHESALQVLSLLQGIEGNKTQKYLYNSSVMFRGRTMSTKFYLKDDEYYKHDFVELKKSGFVDMAYKYLAISQGILRFEISLRKEAINRLFFGVEKGDCYFISWHFTTDTVTHILNRRLGDLLRMNNKKSVTLDQVHQKLVAQYGKIQGLHLYTFYRLYFNEPEGKKKIKRCMERTRIWRNLKKLRDAQVGIASDDIPLNFDLSIPSIYGVNDQAPRGAGSGGV